jgi:ABC-type xylose transport system permease subunit
VKLNLKIALVIIGAAAFFSLSASILLLQDLLVSVVKALVLLFAVLYDIYTRRKAGLG